MTIGLKIFPAAFYQSARGHEPVKEWLLGLEKDDRRTIGEDIRTVEFGWPLGMPLCRSLKHGLWEVRSNISDGRIARTIFAAVDGRMVLLHGFIKKSRATPKADLDLARKRLNEVT